MKKIFQALTTLGIASVSLGPIAMASSTAKDSTHLSDKSNKISDPINESKDDIINKKSQEIIDLQKDIEKLKVESRKFFKLWQSATKGRAELIKANIGLSAHITEIRNEYKSSIDRLKARHNAEISKKQQEIDDYIEKQKRRIPNSWMIALYTEVIKKLRTRNAKLLEDQEKKDAEIKQLKKYNDLWWKLYTKGHADI